jgi:hypothetical protein
MSLSHAGSDSPDFEPETYTELRRELELEKRKLSASVKKTAEHYENTLKLQDRLDNFYKNKICPTCFVTGCKVHCNTCGRETKFSHGDKVYMDKTTSRICILNMDGSEHRMCSVKGPYGIAELDREWMENYRKQDAARIAGTRVWVNKNDYYNKRNP